MPGRVPAPLRLLWVNDQIDAGIKAMKRLGVRFRIRRIMVLVAIVGVVLALAKFFFIENRPREILAATFTALNGEYTVYADGYSEYSLRSIRVGMSIRQVEEIFFRNGVVWRTDSTSLLD